MNMRLLKSRKGRRGFTLIELLVVVLILGVLLAVAIPLYLSSVKTAAEGTVKGNMRQVATAMQAYYVAQGGKPLTSTIAITDVAGANLDLPATFASTAGAQGPKGVNYTCSGTTPATFAVVATETGEDCFKTTATNETLTYTLSTNVYN